MARVITRTEIINGVITVTDDHDGDEAVFTFSEWNEGWAYDGKNYGTLTQARAAYTRAAALRKKMKPIAILADGRWGGDTFGKATLTSISSRDRYWVKDADGNRYTGGAYGEIIGPVLDNERNKNLVWRIEELDKQIKNLEIGKGYLEKQLERLDIAKMLAELTAGEKDGE